jgi:hypothetical protein
MANGARLERCEAQLDSSRRSGTVTVVLASVVRLPIVGTQQVTAGARAGRLSAF